VTVATTLPLTSRLDELPLVFLDLEATGLDPGAGHRVCEVAMLREQAGAEAGRFISLVAPGCPLDPGAAAVNGLDEAQLAGAPPFARVAPAITALVDDALLVGHNLCFDLAFLSAELALLGQPALASPGIDTFSLARRLLRCRSYSLSALAAELGLPAPSHRAMADVLATRALFHHLRGLMADLGIVTLGDAMRFERGLRPGVAEPAPPPLIARALAEGRALRIVYRSRRSPTPTTRIVRPIDLTLEASGVYLRAFCELRQNLRVFAIAKIEQIDLA